MAIRLVELMRREQADIVRQAVMGLSENLREVVVLHFHGDRPEKEIAAILGVSLSDGRVSPARCFGGVAREVGVENNG